MKRQQSVERENKYLVKKRTDSLSRYPHEMIHQGYLVRSPDKIEIRIRHRGRQFTLTVKKGGGSARLEQEIRINSKEFKTLWPLTKGKRIQKIRYKIPYEKWTIELDVYQGALRGLMTADIEFKSPQEAKQFSPPEWLGREITGSNTYSNWRLATNGLPASRKR